jgi:hypothetical protein
MHGRTHEADSVSAISLATTAIEGLEVFMRATMVSAATLSDRTCNRGATPSQEVNHALKPNNMARASATCWDVQPPKVMPTACSSTDVNAVENHDRTEPLMTKNPPAPHGDASKLMETTGPRP